MSGREAIDDLDRRFWAWRTVQAPRSRDDLPRLDRPPGWHPAWSASDVAGYRQQLAAFEAEHARLLAAPAPAPARPPAASAPGGPEARAEEVDLRLIGSAISRARFELDGIASWQRDPWFYLDQTIGTIYDLLLVPPPIGAGRVAELLARLGSFGRHPGRLGPTAPARWPGSWPRRPGRWRRRRAGSEGQPGRPGPLGRAGVVRSLAGGGPGGGGRALDAYAGWLAAAIPGAAPLAGAGATLFARYLYEVALLPFTPAELLAAGRQELDRPSPSNCSNSTGYLRLSGLLCLRARGQQAQAEAAAEATVRNFYEQHDLLSQPASLRHYLNAPRPRTSSPSGGWA